MNKDVSNVEIKIIDSKDSADDFEIERPKHEDQRENAKKVRNWLKMGVAIRRKRNKNNYFIDSEARVDNRCYDHYAPKGLDEEEETIEDESPKAKCFKKNILMFSESEEEEEYV